MAAAAAGTVVTRQSDGQDGPPLLPADAAAAAAFAAYTAPTPGLNNSAVKEMASYKPTDAVDPQHPCRGILRVVDALDGVVTETAPDGTPRKAIAICGFASSTRHYILDRAKRPEWSIWGLNQLYRHIPRADRWFDVHWNWDQEQVPGTNERQWARECGIPFYTQSHEADVPTNVVYPMARVLREFEADYFTSTIPYMIALAVMEIDAMVRPRLSAALAAMAPEQLAQADVLKLSRKIYAEYTIGIYGIDLVVGGEYFHEKPCAEFWIGMAALGRGIKMEIPPESALCKQLFRYGLEKEPNQLLKSGEVRKHMEGLTTQRDEKLKELYMMEGAIQCDGRWAELLDLRSRGAKVD